MVDHFKVMRLLGRGGMAEVYLARDTKLGRKVALKMVRPQDLGSQQALKRFLLEGRATAKFNHPHIVSIYFVGEHHGIPYVALEYLEGQNLRARCSEQRPSLMESLRTGAAVAEALAEAHRHGVLHRDLKPENILVPNDGRVRVLDFGLAKMVGPAGRTEQTAAGAGAADRTKTEILLDVDEAGTFCGSPPYMAPEQWRGKECTPATDLWALGVVMFELVSGVRPYRDRDRRPLHGQRPATLRAPSRRPRAADRFLGEPRPRRSRRTRLWRAMESLSARVVTGAPATSSRPDPTATTSFTTANRSDGQPQRTMRRRTNQPLRLRRIRWRMKTTTPRPRRHPVMNRPVVWETTDVSLARVPRRSRAPHIKNITPSRTHSAHPFPG
jgi:serine/threonine protein kinase